MSVPTRPEIRPARSGDQAEWVRMRTALWPDEGGVEHGDDVATFLATGTFRSSESSLPWKVFVAERSEGGLCGFVEASIRPFAEGCTTRPVGYMEGWFVDPDVRRRGVGSKLVKAAEEWAAAYGCEEMASDAHLENAVSHEAHKALGFEESGRLVHFRKRLPSTSGEAQAPPAVPRREAQGAGGGPVVSMTPEQVAASYDWIADRWLDRSTYGFAQVERAVAFVKHTGMALDVGCGTGRMMGLLGKHGFRTDGIDTSQAMIALARERHPEARLFHADICRWELPRLYDLIVAWDSVWHVPLGQQAAVLTQLCRGLSAGGALVFTTGGTDAPSEKEDSCMGPPMYHATLGIPKTLQVLAESGCVCRHLEYDQHPELHVYIVAQKAMDDGPTTSDPVRLRSVERDDLPRMYRMHQDTGTRASLPPAWR
jgi:SAM-dependent methyltransferase/GNAT superfamily N-acetyltransferase